MTDFDPADPVRPPPPAAAANHHPAAGPPVEDAIERAVAAFARALRLSCRAAGGSPSAPLVNDAVAAHLAARAWAEEAVHRAAAPPSMRAGPEVFRGLPRDA